MYRPPFLTAFLAILCYFSASTQTQFSSAVKNLIDFHAEYTALTHAAVVDVRSNKIIPDQTVLLHNDRIAGIGTTGKINIPSQATVVDLTGKTLLPGLVMLHEHMYYLVYNVKPAYLHLKEMPVSFPAMYLACGITTARTAGSIEPYTDLNLKLDIDSGKMAGPNLDVTAPYLEGKGTMFRQFHELSGPEEATSFVNFWANAGATSFKAYNYINRATLKSAIDAAHSRGLKVTGHLCSITYREAANLGIDQLEHGFMVATDFIPGKKPDECIQPFSSAANLDLQSQAVKDLIQLLVNKKVAITSTLAVFEAETSLQPDPRPEVLEAMSPETKEYYLNEVKNKSSLFNKLFQQGMKLEKMFSDAGGLLTVGTDPTGNGGTLAGYGSQRAIELLVSEGFTPLEAIHIATINGAIALGQEEKIGSIEVGKKADLVVIDGDPSHDIAAIRKVVWVFKNGIGYNSRKMLDSVKGLVGAH